MLDYAGFHLLVTKTRQGRINWKKVPVKVKEPDGCVPLANGYACSFGRYKLYVLEHISCSVLPNELTLSISINNSPAAQHTGETAEELLNAIKNSIEGPFALTDFYLVLDSM